MSFYDEFEKMFSDLEAYQSKLVKKLQSQMDEILQGIESGEIRGNIEAREIDEPKKKGFIIQGRFGSTTPLEPIEPLKPMKRRPLPERLLQVPKNTLEEIREPLTDVFEEDKAIKIYLELPGEEEHNIKLNITDNSIEIKSKNFYKTLDLPKRPIDKKDISTEYKNGVLKVTIPKKPELHYRDEKKTDTV